MVRVFWFVNGCEAMRRGVKGMESLKVGLEAR